MNIKIMELAAQAEEYMEIPMPDDVYHMGDDIFRRHKIFNREKFAELIVRECAGVYDCIDNGNLVMGTDNYLEALQKHFGIEE